MSPVQAIKSAVESAGNDEVKCRVIHSGVGQISEADVQLALASNAPILAFNVRPNRQAKDMAEREGVEIRYYSVIYALIDDVKGVLSGMLAPERRETFIGYAEILQVFDISKLGNIAGCKITDYREREIKKALNVTIYKGSPSPFPKSASVQI